MFRIIKISTMSKYLLYNKPMSTGSRTTKNNVEIILCKQLMNNYMKQRYNYTKWSQQQTNLLEAQTAPFSSPPSRHSESQKNCIYNKLANKSSPKNYSHPKYKSTPSLDSFITPSTTLLSNTPIPKSTTPLSLISWRVKLSTPINQSPKSPSSHSYNNTLSTQKYSKLSFSNSRKSPIQN